MLQKLAQHFEKLAQQILWKWVKQVAFSWFLAIFQPYMLMILVQETLQLDCQILQNWPKLKNLNGNT